MNLRLILYYHNLYINMSNTSENEIIDDSSEHLYDIFSEFSEDEIETVIQLNEIEPNYEIDTEIQLDEIESIDENYNIDNYTQSSDDESGNGSYESCSNESEDESVGEEETNNAVVEEETKESEESSIDNKCVNYALCKKNIFKPNSNYCKLCYLFINKKIKYESNNNNNVCPICLSNNSSDIIIKLFNCSHTICYNCINNIYWHDNDINKIIKNPHQLIHNKWVNYIKSTKSRKLKCFVIYKLVNNTYTDFTEIYNKLIKKINLKLIPSIFRRHLKDLVFYQSQYEIFRTNDSYNKYTMRESIRICPYCREDKS
jgi:hypothetical protein